MKNSLQHVGIMGMHWGVRRGNSDRVTTLHQSVDHKLASGIKQKKISQMSNEEIRTLSARLQLEKQYKDLNPSKIARGKKHVDSVISGLGKAAGVVGSVTVLAIAGKKVYDYAKVLKLG
jgi:hypothetical protein